MEMTNNAMSTPSAAWRQAGKPDPHAGHYDCERAKLTMGHLTDDELANGAFMNYDQPLNVPGILAGTHASPIAWMTAVKDRIRWLSRALEHSVASRAALAAHVADLNQAAVDVLAERRRQVEAEGWTPEHDDTYAHGVLADAAASYALNAGVGMRGLRPMFWPWHATWWKPTTPRRDLVKAGALILAEIERLDRAEAAKTQPRPCGD